MVVVKPSKFASGQKSGRLRGLVRRRFYKGIKGLIVVGLLWRFVPGFRIWYFFLIRFIKVCAIMYEIHV